MLQPLWGFHRWLKSVFPGQEESVVASFWVTIYIVFVVGLFVAGYVTGGWPKVQKMLEQP
jgi:hypothetical protein